MPPSTDPWLIHFIKDKLIPLCQLFTIWIVYFVFSSLNLRIIYFSLQNIISLLISFVRCITSFTYINLDVYKFLSKISDRFVPYKSELTLPYTVYHISLEPQYMMASFVLTILLMSSITFAKVQSNFVVKLIQRK